MLCYSSVIVFRKANKLGFFIKVLPGHPTEDVKVRLPMASIIIWYYHTFGVIKCSE